MNMLLLRAHPEWNERAVQWFHEKWRVPAEAYRESILACQQPGCVVPQWYLVLDDSGEIAAGIGVIENDFHKRRDLSPNVCAVYVEPAHRGQGIARFMLDFVCRDLAAFGEKQYTCSPTTPAFTKNAAGRSCAWPRKTAVGLQGYIRRCWDNFQARRSAPFLLRRPQERRCRCSSAVPRRCRQKCRFVV